MYYEITAKTHHTNMVCLGNGADIGHHHLRPQWVKIYEVLE